MKKKVLLILCVIVILRLIIIFVTKNDPVFYLSPRNFNGRGLLAAPSWLDFIIPLIIIALFPPKNFSFELDFRKLYNTLFPALLLISGTVITGTLLSNYIQKTMIQFDFDRVLLLRYLLFVLTYVSINFLSDALASQKKFFKYIILSLFIVFIAYTQDIFASGNSMYVLSGLLNSVGFSTVIFSIGMRKSYKREPLATIISVSAAGLFLIFFTYNVLSISYFTVFLPFLTSIFIAIALYKEVKLKTKIILGATPVALALFLNFGLPEIVPDELANKLIENKTADKFIEEKAGDITIKYKDKNFRDFAIKLAGVIQAANRVCKNELGFSPEVKELTIKGIGPGGFHAEFPNKIVGNITSEQYMKNCNDSIFLNNDNLSANFPDPVNAILHEYSHLFGVIPYHKWWPGAEEEGWATYSATRIAKMLYETSGAKLWQPNYNYSKQADKITERNLAGKAVVWSHPNEFGGFILWYNIGNKKGLRNLYKTRWKVATHNIKGSLFIISDPAKAKKAAYSLGISNFIKYGQHEIEKFGDIYSKSEYLYMAKTMGIDKKLISKMYDLMKQRLINPSVPVP